MKKYLSKSNVLTFVLLAGVLYLRGPEILKNFKTEGTKVQSQNYQVLSPKTASDTTTFPLMDSKSIAIFWATWCGPCKIEMKRLKSSVDEGKIPPKSIFAINPFESAQVVSNYLKKNDYPFTFIEAPELVSLFNISSTPTTIFFDNNEIHSMSSGLSLIGIWKAENFL